LHHATKEPVVGLWMMEELARHGYKMSTGTLYPILHSMETRGYLRSKIQREGSTSRRHYSATPLGKKALKAALLKVRELYGELLEQ